MSHSTTGEKATAALSALAALLILGAAVTADQSRTTPAGRLAALESDLRFQISLTHRVDGATLKERLAEVDEVVAAWHASPQSGDDYRLIVEWFESSIERSLPGNSGELPAPPKFSVEPAPVAAAPPSPSPVPIARDPAPAAQPAPPAADAVLKPAPIATPYFEPIAEASSSAPKPVVERATESPPAKQPTPPPSIATARPSASTGSAERAHPVAPPIARSAAPPVAPPAPTPVTLASVAAKPVEINFAELNARIAGYHQGVRAIESTLVADRDRLTHERFAELVERLEQLANQYDFVALYYEALSVDERRAVAAPRPLESTVELVQRQLDRLTRGGEGDVLSAFEPPAPAEPDPLAARLQAVADHVRGAAR